LYDSCSPFTLIAGSDGLQFVIESRVASISFKPENGLVMCVYLHCVEKMMRY
jgi:hypothetical protein